jgi:hypothetical protein
MSTQINVVRAKCDDYDVRDEEEEDEDDEEEEEEEEEDEEEGSYVILSTDVPTFDSTREQLMFIIKLRLHITDVVK